MHYLISVIDSGTATGTDEELAAITAFNSRLRDQGHWVMAAGLTSPDDALTIDGRDGVERVTPGPVTNSPEFMSGFWIVDVDDRESAIRLAIEGSRSCHRRVEVRAFHA